MALNDQYLKQPFRYGANPHPAMESYYRFLTEKFVDHVQAMPRGKEPFAYEVALLDTVESWLTHGDAVTACKTFENYLVIVICIMACWADRDFDQPEGHPGDSMFFDSDRVGNVLGAVTPICSQPDHAWQHSALSRTTWDLAVLGRCTT